MFRKLALALVATTALGVAAMTPTTASAWRGWHHGGYHHGYHHFHGYRHWGYRHWGYRPHYRYYGYGYGRGWCYWHPYACYYRYRY